VAGAGVHELRGPDYRAAWRVCRGVHLNRLIRFRLVCSRIWWARFWRGRSIEWHGRFCCRSMIMTVCRTQVHHIIPVGKHYHKPRTEYPTLYMAVHDIKKNSYISSSVKEAGRVREWAVCHIAMWTMNKRTREPYDIHVCLASGIGLLGYGG